MTTTIIFVILSLLYLCTLCQTSDVKLLPKIHHSGTDLEMAQNGGNSWNKRMYNERPDFYSFLTDEQRRSGGRYTPGDYMSFLADDKKFASKKNRDDEYWDFIGADGMKRSLTRKRRSPNDENRTKLDTKVMTPDRRSHDLESWDDFVLGKKRGGGRDPEMSFDDFLLGQKRNNRLSDYDYAEFVLGKRP